MSIYSFLNVFILQWFTIRITKNTEKNISYFKLSEVSILPGGSYGIGGQPTIKIKPSA